MSDFLSQAPGAINEVFYILELIVVRVALLGLLAFGAYALLRRHRP